MILNLREIKDDYLGRQKQWKREVLVCGGAGCVSSNCGEVQDALLRAVKDHGQRFFL